ncbi:hypothetical protein GCM10010199_47250 [Dactylosporangium roseum]
MGRVVIGMDPHKRSATIEVIDARERVLTQGRYGTDTDGYQTMLAAGRRFPDRVWAVEGCAGTGRHIAQRLLADGETVLDVPAKLSARVRVFNTGQGRKTDPVDAHSVAVAGLRSPGLRQIQIDDATVAMRLLVDRRAELGRARTEVVNRIHQMLLEILPGGAKKFLTRGQASYLLRTASAPAGIVAQTRYQLARELIDELTVIDAKIRAADKQLCQLVTANGSSLTDLNGIGPSGAARLIGDIGDIGRFRTAAQFASWNGTAPIEASSGDQNRHRVRGHAADKEWRAGSGRHCPYAYPAARSVDRTGGVMAVACSRSRVLRRPPRLAHSTAVRPRPWSSRRFGSAPPASSSRTVASCPQQAAPHNGSPSSPVPLSTFGSAPAATNTRTLSAMFCTLARYSGVLLPWSGMFGSAPARNNAATCLASPQPADSIRRRCSFFRWRRFTPPIVEERLSKRVRRSRSARRWPRTADRYTTNVKIRPLSGGCCGCPSNWCTPTENSTSGGAWNAFSVKPASANQSRTAGVGQARGGSSSRSPSHGVRTALAWR